MPVRYGFMVILLASILIAVYAGSLYVPFVFDDGWAIYGNPSVIGKAPVSITSARSVLTLSYRLNAYMGGGFHEVNLALHLANGLLVFFIARQFHRISALVALAVFWLHPMVSEGVIYISARSELLSCFFGLAALLAFMRGRPVIASILFVLAVFSKEYAAVFAPLALLCWMDTRKGSFRLATGACVALIAAVVLIQRPMVDWGAESWTSHLLINCGLAVSYMVRILIPIGQSIDHPPMAVWLGVLALSILLSLLVLGLKSNSFRLPVLWIAIAISARIAVNIPEYMAERHFYLAMAGVAFAAGAFWNAIEDHRQRRESYRSIQASLGAVGLGGGG